MMAANRQPRQWEQEPFLETGEPDPVEEYPNENRVVRGSLWMLFLTMALFFFPVVNGMIAGVVGGYRVGSPRNALMAALGPLTIATCLLWIVLTLVPLPVMGNPLSQIGIVWLIVLTDFALLVGAGIGGSVAQNRIDRLNRA